MNTHTYFFVFIREMYEQYVRAHVWVSFLLKWGPFKEVPGKTIVCSSCRVESTQDDILSLLPGCRDCSLYHSCCSSQVSESHEERAAQALVSVPSLHCTSHHLAFCQHGDIQSVVPQVKDWSSNSVVVRMIHLPLVMLYPNKPLGMWDSFMYRTH